MDFFNHLSSLLRHDHLYLLMELMPVCRWVIYLGTVFPAAALAADHGIRKVNIGEPVTLSCTINVKDKEDVATNEIEWKANGEMVAKFSNGNFTEGCGFKDRVHMSREDVRKGDLSLTITHTQMSDNADFDCLYKNQHERAWGLQIEGYNTAAMYVTNYPPAYPPVKFQNINTCLFQQYCAAGLCLEANCHDNIPEEITVTVGQPITIPCYERVRRCSMDPVSFKWLKDNTNIYEIDKGGREKKRRADVSPDGIKNGNFSLVFHKAYFSDRGTYKCNDEEEIVLNLNNAQETRHVSVEDLLSLPLYTVDPVDVYFQKDHSSTPTLMHPTLLMNGRYNNDTRTIEFDAIKMEQIGIYTLTDRQTQKIYYTYILSVENNVLESSNVIRKIVGIIGLWCLFLFFKYFSLENVKKRFSMLWRKFTFYSPL